MAKCLTDPHVVRIRTSLLSDPDRKKKDALLRWEYEAKPAVNADPPRHHVQLRTHLEVGDEDLDLDRLHTPTGGVTLEEVLRFADRRARREAAVRREVARGSRGGRGPLLRGVHGQAPM